MSSLGTGFLPLVKNYGSGLPAFDEDGEITRYNVFRAAMIIRHGEDNKKYLYDIINIKKEMSNLFQS